jgi:hypothetical protein
MNLLDVELVNEPLEIDSFSYLSDSDYPVIMLGFQLKNLYDQKRITVSQQYKSIDIIHFIPKETMMPKFFRGVRIPIRSEYIPLISSLETLGLTDQEEIKPTEYKALLQKFNLTCNNCFAFLQKGIYPIDSECLNTFSSQKFSIDEIYSSFIDTKNIAKFQALSYPVIYVLSNKNKCGTSTKNFIHAVVKKYNNS